MWLQKPKFDLLSAHRLFVEKSEKVANLQVCKFVLETLLPRMQSVALNRSTGGTIWWVHYPGTPTHPVTHTKTKPNLPLSMRSGKRGANWIRCLEKFALVTPEK